MLIEQLPSGLSSLRIPAADVDCLTWVLDPEIPFVLVEHHRIDSTLRWYEIAVPLSIGSQDNAHRLTVRSVSMDICLRTREFLDLLHEFRHDGLDLVQMTHKPPATFRYFGRADGSAPSMGAFRDLGIQVAFSLPHPGEAAVVVAPAASSLEAALSRRGALPLKSVQSRIVALEWHPETT
jgi:hypothetical protein